MEDGIIATFYRIDPTQAAVQLEGGLTAHRVTDRREPSTPLMAIETRANLPARPRITLARSGTPIKHAVLPVDYGTGQDRSGHAGWFVVGEAVPGAALAVGQPWREADLIALVLAPAAIALAGLQARGLTHRAINPANLFRTGPRDMVTLGPFWAAPPASLQPTVCEPPYMARCLPGARGDGCIADDVYALGVTILALATGRMPLAGLDDAAIIRRKLDLGSFDALTESTSLPPLISDLLRGMLAEDPDHRPSPALLSRPEQARARRVAARPPRRAQTPLDLGGTSIWTARELAHVLGLQPDQGYLLLTTGDVEKWLRRALGDPQLGMRVEEVMRHADSAGGDEARMQAQTVMRCVSAIDPLAPMVWRGMALQPDGLGPAVASASPAVLAALQDVVTAEAVADFYASSYRKQGHPTLKDEQRDWRAWLTARGPAGGVNRLTYGMNPMLPCASPLLAGQPVVRAAELLPALDAAAAAADRTRPPIDGHVAAFIAARVDLAIVGNLTALSSFAGTEERSSVLQLFARMQSRLYQHPLPGLAGWLVSCGLAGIEDWHSLKTRAQLKETLQHAVEAGQIDEIVALLDNEPARRADREGAAHAVARVEALNGALAGITRDAPLRGDAAQLLGYEMVTGIGMIASLGATLALALH